MRGEPGCPACGSSDYRPLFTVQGADYIACHECGLARMDPMPSDTDLLANFDAGYFEGAAVPGGYDDYGADEELHRRNARRRLDRIARHRGALTPRSLLDIGCAYGYALDEAREAGWSAVGVEPSPEAAFHARARGLPVFSDVAAATSAHPEGFDVVCLCQVLSHVPDPLATVTGAVKSLKPGGLLFIETWRRDAWPARVAGRHWHVIVPPTVVWLETSRSIRSLLDRVGLEVVDWTRGHKTVSAGLVASLLGTGPFPDALAGVAQRVGRSRWARAGVRYPFDDLVWVTAEAPG